MSTTSTVKKYVQKFRKSWLDREELRDWLIENPNVDVNGKYGGFCVFCNIALPSKLYDLQSHASSRKHARNVSEKSRADMEEEDALIDVCRTVLSYKSLESENGEDESKEDIFGKYIASELKLIKSQKVYEEVKWTIINTLRNAINQQCGVSENEA